MTSTAQQPKPHIMSTSGAISLRNDKGEFVTEKVKVNRYVTGKRPEYAPESSSDEDSDMEANLERKRFTERKVPEVEKVEVEVMDRRLRRLQQREAEADDDDDEDNDRLSRHRRRVIEPEVVEDGGGERYEIWKRPRGLSRHRRRVIEPEVVEDEGRREVRRDEDESSEEELEEDEMEQRRALLRKRAMERQEEEELLNIEGEKSDGESELSSEYESEYDSEQETGPRLKPVFVRKLDRSYQILEKLSSEYESEYDSEQETGPRLKPVFVRKKDRVTIQEKQKQEQHKHDLEVKAKSDAQDRRKQTVKMVEEQVRADRIEQRSGDKPDASDLIDSGDENDEVEYAAWKVRELKRIKRCRDERDAAEKEKVAIERVRNMTEDERRQELRHNPKLITNKAGKGKYKFLQKYYHRGAFFLDKEDSVYTQDFTAATLEDHFDRTILPKVMQVKNFGRSGRTKYTHLVDQDTTNYESPWLAETAQNIKFHSSKGGGMKQQFTRPSVKPSN